MDIQPSSIAPKSPPGQDTPQADYTDVSMPAPVAVTPEVLIENLAGKNLGASVRVSNTPSAQIEGVSIFALSSTGDTVAAFRTVGPIHPRVSEYIVEFLKKPLTPDNTDTMIRSIYNVLHQRSAVQWEQLPTGRQACPADEQLRIQLVPPTLVQLMKCPSVVDNQFGAHWVSQFGSTRAIATVDPFEGHAVISLNHEQFAPERSSTLRYKIIPPADLALVDNDVKTFLCERALQIITLAYQGGLTEVAEQVAFGELEVMELDSEPLRQRQLDHLISTGELYSPPTLEKTLSSGALVKLHMGQRCAAISVSPSPDQSRMMRTIVYSCPANNSQLTAWQIHFIRDVYDSLSSDSPKERIRGARLCGKEPLYLSRPASSTGQISTTMDVDSPYSLGMAAWNSGYTLKEVIGESYASRLAALVDFEILLNEKHSSNTILELLEGTRTFSIRPRHKGGFPVHPENFTNMELSLLNSGGINVVLRNGLGSRYDAWIPPGHILSESSAETVVELVDFFANQPNFSWRELHTTVSRLSSDGLLPPEERLWGLSQNDLPPPEDQRGVEMLEASAKMYSWLAGGAVDGSFPYVKVQYCGPGSVGMEVWRSNFGPLIQLIVADGILREFRVCQQSTNTPAETRETLPVLRFHSETLPIDSPETWEILASCSAALHEVKFFCPPKTPHECLPKAVKELKRTLEKYMHQLL